MERLKERPLVRSMVFQEVTELSGYGVHIIRPSQERMRL
jgi:hypothetical protein